MRSDEYMLPFSSLRQFYEIYFMILQGLINQDLLNQTLVAPVVCSYGRLHNTAWCCLSLLLCDLSLQHPGILPQINHLHTSLCLRLYFWGNQYFKERGHNCIECCQEPGKGPQDVADEIPGDPEKRSSSRVIGQKLSQGRLEKTDVALETVNCRALSRAHKPWTLDLSAAFNTIDYCLRFGIYHIWQ